MEILKIENLTFTYPKCDFPAVNNVSFSVESGEFIGLCGATGSGKSSLLRLLKPEISPLGEKSGSIYLNAQNTEEISPEISAREIGYVMQSPEQQIVTDKVWHELAFGLENLNLPQNVIARRVAEMASYFGIEDWFEKNTNDLSGGQKQILNLAAVMVMQPKLLILDEPTAQLDPIAASEFISTVKKINRELSVTVIICEHRLEEVIPLCDKLLVLEKGEISAFASPKEVISALKGEIIDAMPAAARIFLTTGAKGECPLDIADGRRYIETNFKNEKRSLPQTITARSEKIALEFKNVWFRYEKETPDVLKGLDLQVRENEIYCILGGNGSGKTTSLLAASGILKIYGGNIKVFGKKLKEYKNQTLYKECLALLPQDVQTVFLKNTVREELADAKAETELLPYDISHLLDKHPYDLSGGEQQLVALAKVLALKPKLLLLDEPTKGLDAFAKKGLIKILKQLKTRGMTIIIVTHDVEFASLCGDVCSLFFRGNILSEGVPNEFFAENSFYTTSANRMTRGFYDNAVTAEDVAELCRLNGRKGGGNDRD